METEKWKKVRWNSINENYNLFVSTAGRLKYNNDIRKPYIGDNGYYRTNYKDSFGRWKTIEVHRLVFSTFKGDQPRGLDIDHIDDNKLNNNLENLQLLSRSANILKGKKYYNYGRDDNNNLRINGEHIIRTVDKKFYELLYDISEHFMSVYYYEWNDEPITFSKKRDDQNQLIFNKETGLYKVNGFLDIENDTAYNYIIEGEYTEKEALQIIHYIDKINKAINKKDRNYEYKNNDKK